MIHRATIAGNAVAAIVLNIHVSSRDYVFIGYVINRNQISYKIGAVSLVVIAAVYVIINKRKNRRKRRRSTKKWLLRRSRLGANYTLLLELRTYFPKDITRNIYARMQRPLTVYLRSCHV